MSDDLKFQLRLTLCDEFAPVARTDPGNPSISPLTNILNRHDAVLKCQFDAFADYVSEAEANGVENYHLYEWTKKTVDDPAKKAKYVKSFTLYVGGQEVYEKDQADALEAELKPLVGGPIVAVRCKGRSRRRSARQNIEQNGLGKVRPRCPSLALRHHSRCPLLGRLLGAKRKWCNRSQFDAPDPVPPDGEL